MKDFLNEGERQNGVVVDILKGKYTKTGKIQKNKTHDLKKYYYRKDNTKDQC